MKFLLKQVIVVALVCIFFTALSNLTELGVVGWILAASTGHGLYKIYVHIHNSFGSNAKKRRCKTCDTTESDFSKQIERFIYDDASGISRDD